MKERRITLKTGELPRCECGAWLQWMHGYNAAGLEKSGYGVANLWRCAVCNR